METPKHIQKNAHGEIQGIAEHVPVQKPLITRLTSGARVVIGGLWHGIPVELAFVVSPEKKKSLLEEFWRDGDGLPINKQVQLMLGLLTKHFPELIEHSQKWMAVRAHFFGSIGLWGKFG